MVATLGSNILSCCWRSILLGVGDMYACRLHCIFLHACHREGKLLAALLKLDFRSALAVWEPRVSPWLDVLRASLATGSTTFAILHY